MRLIKPSVEVIWEPNMWKLIELAGRICYKSEDKITDDSAKKFVDMLITRGHGAMLEHGTIYLTIKYGKEACRLNSCYPASIIQKYEANSFSKVTDNKKDLPKLNDGPIDGSEHEYYITTNYRVLVQNNWLDDLQYQVEPTDHHIKRYSVKFICDRGVSHELVRHRASFAQESTRYCSYDKDKFNNNVTFIIPVWNRFACSYVHSGEDFHEKIANEFLSSEEIWFNSMIDAEKAYFELLENGWIAQQARAVLPNSLKTEVVMTYDEDGWEHFFKMRCPKTAHPQMRELSIPLLKMFNEINPDKYPLNNTFGEEE